MYVYIILPNNIDTMSSDTNFFDATEKLDILVKNAFGFPTTDESRAWYEETTVPFNDYSIGEDVLIDKIPAIPDFDTNGIVRTAADIGLTSNDFVSYAATGDKRLCSIVDDATGVVRRIKLLILDETPQLATPGASWYKLNSNKVNVIKDAFQFNYKTYTDANSNIQLPYLYKVNTQNSLNATLPFGAMGGNWLIDFKVGILLFPDFGNFTTLQTDTKFKVNTTNNKPVLTIYTYIGRKGTPKILDLLSTLDASLNSMANITSPTFTGILTVSKLTSGDASFNGNIDISGSLTVTGDVSFNSKLSVARDVSFGTKLNVGSDASFNSKLSVGNDVSFNNNLTVANDVSFGTKLNVGSDAYFNSKLGVGNDVSFNNKLTVANDVSFGSKLNVGADSFFNSKLSV
jgi:hypothetical protein